MSLRGTKQPHAIQGEDAEFAIASSPLWPFIAMTLSSFYTKFLRHPSPQ